jgi:hypothetical protein
VPGAQTTGASAHPAGGRTQSTGTFAHPARTCVHAIDAFVHSTGAHAQPTSAFAHSTSAFAHSTGAFAHSTGAFAHSTGAFAHSTGAFAHSRGAFAHPAGACTHSQAFVESPAGRRQQLKHPFPSSPRCARTRAASGDSRARVHNRIAGGRMYSYKQSLQTFRRVRDFLSRSAPDVALGSVTAQGKALNELIDRLSMHGVEVVKQGTLTREGTMQVRTIARSLRMGYLRPLLRIARTVPGGDALVRGVTMPRSSDPERLVSATLAVVEALQPQVALFVAAGCAPDFTDRVTSVAGQLKAVLDARANSVSRRALHAAGIQEEIARGYAIVRTLNLMLAHQLEQTPTLLAEWRSLMRQGIVAATTKPATPPATDTPSGDAGQEVRAAA